MVQDNKYITFKQEDFDRMMADANVGPAGAKLLGQTYAVPDATVIRGKDLLAGPALHCYAAMAALIARVSGSSDDAARADYFHERAVEADELFVEGIARIPD